LLIFAVISSCGFVKAESSDTSSPLDLGRRRECFIDDYLIDRLVGDVEQRLHTPRPEEVVLHTDRPWEGNTCGYFTIFQDGARYRMYYRGSHSEQGKMTHEVTCYAESKDGIHWKRPCLGLCEFAGSKENNIVWDGLGTHNFTPFLDKNPNVPEAKRYKAVGRGKPKAEKGLYAFESPDGLHWSLLQKEPVITTGAFDSQNLAFWDPVAKKYRAYWRDFHEGVRGIRTAVSDDMIHWSEPVWLEYSGLPKQHLYTNQVLPYSRSPHLLLGFPTRFLPKRDALTEGLLMCSRDGVHFHVWPEALIRPGRHSGKWQNRSNYIWWGMLETPSDLPGHPLELSLFVNESYYDGDGSDLRRYTVRPDGFVSIHASFEGGEMITRPFLFSGKRLCLNFSTSAAGSVRVEVLDAEGKPRPGFMLAECPAMYGDELERPVSWQHESSLESLVGKPVRLRFVLRDADLYSLRFAE
jgi:hypothetical protein